jgi:hypothetical protein
MFTRLEYLAKVAGDRKASDAPVSARVRDAEAGANDDAAASAWVTSGGRLSGLLPQAVRATTAAAATEAAIAGLPARLLPGVCAFPASNDTVASPVFDRHAVSKVVAALAH